MTDIRERVLTAITRSLRDCAGEGADPEVTARHVLAAVEGLGWRFTPAVAPVNWQPAVPGTGLPKAGEVRALLDAARNDCEAATTVVRPDLPRDAA